MARRSRLAIILGLVLVAVSTVACASSSDLEQVRQDLAATKTELAQAKTDLGAANQRVAALEEQFKAAQEATQKAVALVQGDLSNVTRDTTALKTNVTTLQSDVSKTTKDIASLGTDLTSAKTSLADLKNSLGLTRDDVAKLKKDVGVLQTTDPDELRVGLAILALNLYYLTDETNIQTSFRTAAAKVGDVVKLIGDSTLTSAWDNFFASWEKFVATIPNTPERQTASQDTGAKEDAFMMRLLQLIMG